MTLHVAAREEGAAVVVAVSGTVSAETVPTLHVDLVRLVAGSAFRIVLDLSDAVVDAPLTDVVRDLDRRVRPYRGWLRLVAPRSGTDVDPPGGPDTPTYPSVPAALEPTDS